MFDLESHIATWRESFRGQQVDDNVLVEMESHLRDLFASLKRSERSEDEAWRKAIASFGDARAIAGEYRKSCGFIWWPSLCAIGVLSIAVAGVSALMMKRGVRTPTDWLLLPHVVTTTVGYTALFATALMAICGIIQRAFRRWDAPRDEAFEKYGLIFSVTAAIAIAVGFVLGSLWWKQTHGRLLDMDSKELGGVAALAWALVQVAIFRWKGLSPSIRMISGLVANIVTGLAWFAPVMLDSRRAYGMSALPSVLAAFVAVNLVLAAVALFVPSVNDRGAVKSD